MGQEINPQTNGFHHHLNGDRPDLLVLRPGLLFKVFEQEFLAKFNVLKAFESPLPLDKYLRDHAQSARAILCEAIVTRITADLLLQLPALQLVVADGTGVNHIDLAECHRRGISVTNTGDVFSEDTADYGVGLLIDVLRRISRADAFVRRGSWPLTPEFPVGRKVGGKRVGIVGLGNIGTKLAKRVEAFGCKVSYNSRTKKQSAPYDFYPTVVDLASQSDILIICCSLTDKTRHIINAEVLNALGKNGILINIGRGPIVDEETLVKYLVDAKIAGAAMDVYENEPRVPSELFGLDNVVLSPHRGAFTEEAFFDAFKIVMGNLDAFFANKSLLTPLTTNE
ncbi:glyoxylate/hydroxypyruvate reductase HPR3-like [Salvia hispanica]|uniref:glyoxylate/hydroxypyruvate reductase HPR3-like n=1 Tax=Salvia hispanica TaxID=49212 RepID=UPI002008F0B4|nr:glyoxylate/hydroxypyruvate reductase HPR3-like [Salvia hispanica]